MVGRGVRTVAGKKTLRHALVTLGAGRFRPATRFLTRTALSTCSRLRRSVFWFGEVCERKGSTSQLDADEWRRRIVARKRFLELETIRSDDE